MIDVFIDIWSSMPDLELFYYPVACMFLYALIVLVRGFFGRGVKV